MKYFSFGFFLICEIAEMRWRPRHKSDILSWLYRIWEIRHQARQTGIRERHFILVQYTWKWNCLVLWVEFDTTKSYSCISEYTQTKLNMEENVIFVLYTQRRRHGTHAHKEMCCVQATKSLMSFSLKSFLISLENLKIFLAYNNGLLFVCVCVWN